MCVGLCTREIVSLFVYVFADAVATLHLLTSLSNKREPHKQRTMTIQADKKYISALKFSMYSVVEFSGGRKEDRERRGDITHAFVLVKQ